MDFVPDGHPRQRLADGAGARISEPVLPTSEQYRSIKTVFTIHNIQYQGKYGMEILEDTLAIGRQDAHLVEYDGCVNFMKGAIECADKGDDGFAQLCRRDI